MTDPNNIWGGNLKQQAVDGGFGLAFDPSVATTLSAECASMLSAVEAAAAAMATSSQLKALSQKTAGPQLATIVNTAAADLNDRLLNGNRTILTDMGETFVIAGGLYNKAESDSQSAFLKLKNGASPAAVDFQGADLPGWKPSSGRGHEYFSHSAERDYANSLVTTGEATSLGGLAKETGVTLKPSTVDLDGNRGEDYSWDEFAAHYDYVDGQQIPGQLEHFADSWKKAADILRAQAETFHKAYDPLLQSSLNGANGSGGAWASPAAGRAKSALNDYLSGLTRLISGMDLMSRNLAVTQGWMLRLQTFLPLNTYEVYRANNSARRLDEDLRQIRSAWDSWFVEGAKLTAGNIPEFAPVRSTVTTPSAGLPTSLSELLIGDQTPGEQLDPLRMLENLRNGVPYEVVNPDGSHTIITPNPDGTTTTTKSTTAPDGSVTTVSTTGDGAPVTSVSTPRNDGSGIIDTVTTNPDGTVTTTVSTPTGDGRLKNTTTNADGTTGLETAVTELPEGKLLTETVDPDSATVTNTLTQPNGFSYTETYGIDADGNPSLLSTNDSSGTRSTVASDGAISTQFPDGTWAKTTQLPDGSAFTQFSDGTIRASEPGQPVSTWQAVTSFLGFEGHPNTTWGGMSASGIAAGLEEGGTSMAAKAAMMADTSRLLGQGALQDLADGTGLPGKQTSVALQIGDDATKLATNAKWLGGVGKFGGPLATIGFSTYNSWDDYNNGLKTGCAAIGNGLGSSAGGIAGGMALGALGGAWLGPPGAIGGAIIGGLVGGAGGGMAGEATAKAVCE